MELVSKLDYKSLKDKTEVLNSLEGYPKTLKTAAQTGVQLNGVMYKVFMLKPCDFVANYQ
jgi:hypothetical protein